MKTEKKKRVPFNIIMHFYSFSPLHHLIIHKTVTFESNKLCLSISDKEQNLVIWEYHDVSAHQIKQTRPLEDEFMCVKAYVRKKVIIISRNIPWIGKKSIEIFCDSNENMSTDVRFLDHVNIYRELY